MTRGDLCPCNGRAPGEVPASGESVSQIPASRPRVPVAGTRVRGVSARRAALVVCGVDAPWGNLAFEGPSDRDPRPVSAGAWMRSGETRRSRMSGAAQSGVRRAACCRPRATGGFRRCQCHVSPERRSRGLFRPARGPRPMSAGAAAARGPGVGRALRADPYDRRIRCGSHFRDTARGGTRVVAILPCIVRSRADFCLAPRILPSCLRPSRSRVRRWSLRNPRVPRPQLQKGEGLVRDAFRGRPGVVPRAGRQKRPALVG